MGAKHIKTKAKAEQVYKAASLGMRVVDIVQLIGMRNHTCFKDHYEEEYNKGFSEAKEKVTKLLWNKMQDGNMSAIIFYLKTRCGWKDPEKGEFPIETRFDKKGFVSSEDIIKFRESLIKKVAEGEISPADASSLSNLLKDQDASIEKREVDILREELKEIKNMLSKDK